MVVALDTETTGLDLRHGCRPFFVSTCTEDGRQRWWEWDVDPVTRGVRVPEDDLGEVRELLGASDRLVLQNSKFDAHALASVGVADFPWGKVDDTLFAGHLLSSDTAHDLTSLVLRYTGIDLTPFEEVLHAAVEECRRTVQQAKLRVKRGRQEGPEPLARWRIGADGDPLLPSGGGKRSDYWLPRAMAAHRKYPRPAEDCDHRWEEWSCVLCGGHRWWVVLREYANSDTFGTAAAWLVMSAEVERRGLNKIYEDRMRLLPVVYGMERDGVTVSEDRITGLIRDYSAEAKTLAEECVAIAARHEYELAMPAGAANQSLRAFCFDVLKLEPTHNPKAKTDAPTLDKTSFEHYMATLPDGDAREFVERLVRRRKLTTSVGYMETYLSYVVRREDGAAVLYPNLNPTATKTLRHSSDSPNEQSVGKSADEDGVSLRTCFGPAPGREWWALDYENIELRIPAYESGERELIDLFEKSSEPPYYGSEHMLNFHTVYPDVWDEVVAKVGLESAAKYIKVELKSTWYKRCKNGGFATGYQAGDRTADRAFGRPGSRARLRERFAKKEALNAKYVAMANRLGYVETIPDRTVDPSRGYPIRCARGERGGAKPTHPLNYHVQSTAMQCTNKAMVRCGAQIDRWNRERDPRLRVFITVETHDEIVFDFPRGGRRNLPMVRRLQALMEQSGDDVGIPLRVSVSYHPTDWGREEEVA